MATVVAKSTSQIEPEFRGSRAFSMGHDFSDEQSIPFWLSLGSGGFSGRRGGEEGDRRWEARRLKNFATP